MGDIIVQKYGGSSVATTEKIITIAKRLIERKKTNPKIVVVVSAMGDTTDDYISLAKEITDTRCTYVYRRNDFCITFSNEFKIYGL